MSENITLEQKKISSTNKSAVYQTIHIHQDGIKYTFKTMYDENFNLAVVQHMDYNTYLLRNIFRYSLAKKYYKKFRLLVLDLQKRNQLKTLLNNSSMVLELHEEVRVTADEPVIRSVNNEKGN